MTVAIRFPDGSIRDVPGQLVARTGTGTTRITTFVQTPVNCDALWHYEQEDGQWVASARHPNVATLTPVTREWWQSITQMDDRAEDPESNVA